MSDQSPLIVPMTVEALVVNDPMRAAGQFFRADMAYSGLYKGQNGQPTLSDNDGNFKSTGVVPPNNVPASQYYDGVYLKWRLPAIFTEGEQDNVTNQTNFLPVPNRWLVVRYSGTNLASRTATAWIIESDYQWPSNPSPNNLSQSGSLYVVPFKLQGQTLPAANYIGRNVQLGTWTESGLSLGLTAQGPGNNAFAFYQPQCNNVFSFVDPLVSAGVTTPQTLSYLVLGWYSQAGDDPLHGATTSTFSTILDGLRWTLPKGSATDSVATWTLLSGMVTGVQWQTSSVPAGGAPVGAPAIAVGNSSIEALTALITAQAAAAGANVEPELLEAFQLDLIDVLDQPDGAAVLAEKLRTSFFQKFSGGYTWTIVDAPDSNTEVPEAELEKEAQWLAALNQAQQKLDDDLTQLVSLQTQLYVMWWKFANYKYLKVGTPVDPKLQTINALQAQIDPSSSGSLAAQVAAQLTVVSEDLEAVPNGATADALQQAIDDYASKQQLPSTRVLKRAAAPAYYLANNPVVLLSGVGASGLISAPETIMCRFGTAGGSAGAQLITGFTYQGKQITAATPGLVIPQPNVSGASGVPWSTSLVTALVQEFFFLDTDNAAAVAAALGSSDIQGIADAMGAISGDPDYPTNAVQRWAGNPWHPLLLLWQAQYYGIAYSTGETTNWTFYNGQYTWNGSSASVETPFLGVQGLIQLAPTAALNMKARLDAFLRNNPSLPSQEMEAFEELEQFIEDEDHWDVLSQALDGFNDQLRLGQSGVFMSPASTSLATNPPLTTLLGGVGSYPPNLGTIPTSTNTQSQFQPWRAGQFLFTQLLLIDEWGQAIWPITSTNYTKVPIVIPPSLSPIVASNSVALTIASGPAIAALEPPVAAAGGGALTLTVTGAGFSSGAAVQWNGTALATTFVSATQLSAQVPASALAKAGTASVTVTSGGAPSSPVSFTIAAGPAIGSLTPDLMQAGMATSATIDLTVEGVGFTSSAVVQWNGTPLTTDFVSGTTLIAHLPASFTAAPLQASVTVAVGGATSPAVAFTVSPGAAIGSLDPAVVAAGGGGFTLAVSGVGFSPASVVTWNNAPLATTFISESQLTAQVAASLIASAGSAAIVESVGATVQPATPAAYIQVPPAVLQPAQLDFELVSAADDDVPFGPANPDADPICGWVVPNHLDSSILAFDPQGNALGEMLVGMPATGDATICWRDAPGSPYTGLGEIAGAFPHFGPFLLALSQKSTTTFAAFQRAIDETLWTTVPMDAAFDQSLAVLIGRPLAMVRASLELLLNGDPYLDPSWQYTFTQQTPAITTYSFSVELGNVAQLDDGLIGYFVGDDYDTFNVVEQSGASADGYLDPIGANGNYLSLGFNGEATFVSMLVDPRAGVHATTGILPDVTLELPPQFVDAALAAMNITFRIDGFLTDQQTDASGQTTLLMPVPKVTSGTWSWVENDEQKWNTFDLAPNDTSARLSNVPPVLRTGLLQLASGVSAGPTTLLRRRPSTHRKQRP